MYWRRWMEAVPENVRVRIGVYYAGTGVEGGAGTIGKPEQRRPLDDLGENRIHIDISYRQTLQIGLRKR
jgi:hypothetical protein